MTFDEIGTIEPRLLELQRKCSSIPKGLCANTIWYGSGSDVGFKEELLRLVGWEADDADPRLQSEHAYDVAYNACYGALPNCRNQCYSCGLPVRLPDSFNGVAPNREDEASTAALKIYAKRRGHVPSVLCALDVLGYQRLVTTSSNDGYANHELRRYRDALGDARAFLYGTADNPWVVKEYTDNTLLSCPIKYDGGFALDEIGRAAADFQLAMLMHGFAVRGAITVGNATADLHSSFGESLIEAHHLEQRIAIYPRVILNSTARGVKAYELAFWEKSARSRAAEVNIIVDGLDTWSIDYLFERAVVQRDLFALRAHREMIIELHGRYGSAAAVLPKYEWLTDYHNFVCGEQGLSELKIDFPLTHELHRVTEIELAREFTDVRENAFASKRVRGRDALDAILKARRPKIQQQ